MSIVLARLTAPLQHTGSLYLATYAQAVFGMLLAIAFGRITTMSRQIDVVTRRHEPDTRRAAHLRCSRLASKFAGG